MNFLDIKPSFDAYMGVKNIPNEHEVLLFVRAKKYIEKIENVPGIRMIAIVNSLSMYATDRDSDIDLFIITEKNRMWLARIWITCVFWVYGVWRHKEEIAGNFCLSFWIEESAMDMRKIAITDDIYLFFWMYYMKPIILYGDVWEQFQKMNPEYQFSPASLEYLSDPKKESKSWKGLSFLYDYCNKVLAFLGEKKSRKRWNELRKPEGVIIGSDILKFHDKDARKSIREAVIGSSR